MPRELTANERLFSSDLGVTFCAGSDTRRGVAPFRTGVTGGKTLWNCSGLSLGPNETLLRLELGAIDSVDFLFLPELRLGVISREAGK